jgi:PAS domain S-box-containing protein
MPVERSPKKRGERSDLRGRGSVASDLTRAVFDDAAVPAAIVRLQDGAPPVFVDANRAFCRVIGCDLQAIGALVVSDVLDGFENVVAAVGEGVPASSVRGACRPPGGNLVRAALHGTLLSPDGDQPRLLMVQITDMPPTGGGFERALQDSEKRVQDVLDNVNALIYIKAPDGTFLLVNSHFEDMFGISRHDAPHSTNADFFPPEIAEIYTANDRTVLETGVPMEFEEPQTDGGAWLSLKFPLFDVDGRIYAVAGISTDITGRSRAAATARQAKEEAERANEAKSEFLSRMSHELRTPLNSILGFGQLLQLEELPGGTRESVDRIVKAGRHLLALINEVLEISRIEANAPPGPVDPMDVCRPLVEALELVRPLADEREIDISTDFHGGLYRFVLADEQRLTQVLLNVLSNAIKYNRIGGQVRISFRDAEDRRLRLCVADTGYGIAPNAIAKAFMPFERLGADKTATEGSGLGLTLSRSLMEAMGGTIDVERSQPGEGTTFFVELPLADNGVVVRPEPLDPRDGEPLQAMTVGPGTVLYIEDNLSNLDLVRGLLSRVGSVRLIPAVQGGLGIELAARHRPDLILLDLHLPDLSGDEVLKRLREDERTRSIPVIVLSADATRDQIERLKRQGAAEYVTKPIDVPTFLGAVRGVLGPRPSRPTVRPGETDV